MPKTSSNAWRCSCGTEMARLCILYCTDCGLAKEKGLSLLKKKGDWLCTHCGCNNFANRVKCYNSKCKKKRTVVSMAAQEPFQGQNGASDQPS